MGENGYLIKSLVKAFKILEAFKHKKKYGITELSNKFDIPKSTIYNFLFTFEKLGYIRQMENGNYKLSSKIFEISQSIEYDLRNEAIPYLRKLSEETNETVNLVILTDEKVLYIEKVESSQPININTKVGKKEDVYCTAVGKAILAYLNKNKQKNIFQKIEFHSHAPNTITNLESLKKELAKIKECGYAIDEEEFAKGVKCIAAPIFNYKGEPISAISITGPIDRINSHDEDKIISHIVNHALKISEKLGFNEELN